MGCELASGCTSGSSKALHLDAVLFERVADLPWREPEDARGFRLHPSGLLHGLDERLPAGLRKRAVRLFGVGVLAVRRRVPVGHRALVAPEGQPRASATLRRGYDVHVNAGPFHSMAERQWPCMQAKSCGVDFGARRHGGGAAHAVLQLADVAGEIALAQHL